MEWYLLPAAMLVFLLIVFMLNCIEEAVKFYDWREEDGH